jgi:hypothetical protein
MDTTVGGQARCRQDGADGKNRHCRDRSDATRLTPSERFPLAVNGGVDSTAADLMQMSGGHGRSALEPGRAPVARSTQIQNCCNRQMHGAEPGIFRMALKESGAALTVARLETEGQHPDAAPDVWSLRALTRRLAACWHRLPLTKVRTKKCPLVKAGKVQFLDELEETERLCCGAATFANAHL